MKKNFSIIIIVLVIIAAIITTIYYKKEKPEVIDENNSELSQAIESDSTASINNAINSISVEDNSEVELQIIDEELKNL